MLKIMSHKAEQGGAPVYAYMFTWENAGTGSNHGAEIPFVFDNIDGGDAATQKLAETVSQAWINFAKTGIPSAEDLPEWEAYNRENGATMILDTETELVHNHDKELMGLLEPDYIY
jgi:para-nitrobenzyl esterase